MDTKHLKTFKIPLMFLFLFSVLSQGEGGGVFSLLPLLLNESPKGGFPSVAIVHLFCTIDTIVKD